MKKDLLTTLSSFSFFTRDYHQKQLKFILILILLIFYTSSKAQISHPFTTSGSLLLPAGMDVVTVEGWGAGGAGGGAKVTPGEGRSGGGGGGGAYAKGTITTTGLSSLAFVVGATAAGGAGDGASGGASYITGFTTAFNAPGGQGGKGNTTTTSTPTGGAGGTGPIGNLATAVGAGGTNGKVATLSLLLSSGAGGDAGGYPTVTGAGAGGLAKSTLILTDLAGNNGGNSGGGGGGAVSANIAQNGGSGASGSLNITYTCKTYSLTGISAPNVCTGTTTQVQLTGTAASLPAGTYTVKYNISLPNTTGQTETMVVNTAGSGSFTARGLTTLGNCNITVTSLTSVDCTSSISTNNVANIIVSAQPTITLGATTAVCTSAALQNVTLPYTAVTNIPTRYSITWNSNPANSFLPVTNVILPATPISIAVPAGTPAGIYTGSLTVSNAAGCISAANNFTITVNPLPSITLGATTAVCTSSGAQSTTLPYTAVTNSPTNYSITWNASPTNTFAAVSNAALPASPINIPIPANTAAGTYTGSLTVSNANGCISSANNFTVTVNGLPTITLGTAAPVCFSAAAQTANLNYSATTNSPTTYSIAWNASPTNSFLAVTNAALTSSPISIAVPAGTNAGTYTGTLTVKNANGCVSAANSFSITVNPLPSITLGATTAVCPSSSAQSTTLPYTAVTNSPTNYSITWNASPTNTFAAVSNAALPASPINIPIPANTAAGTYTGSLTVSNANGCVSSANNFTVTVNGLPTITLGTTAPVCFSAAAQTANLNYSATTNSPTTYSITWNASPTNNFLAVTNATLTSSPISIAVPAGTNVGTYTGTLTVKNANGCVSTANNFTVTVNPLPTITLGATTAVCPSSSAQSTTLPYTAVTNSPTNYSITWNASPTNTFAAVSNATLPSSPINIPIPANTAAGTYTGTLTVSNANGCVSSANNFTVTVNPLPTITLAATTAVCPSSSAQSTTLPYTATANSPTNYSITWNASPTNSFAPVSNASLSASPINIPIPANTAAGTYTGTLTVSNANGCVSSANNFTVTVNPLPTITLGATTAVCPSSSAQSTTLPYTATANSPTNYSITWNASPTNSFAAVSNAALPASPINIPIPANTAAGTYTGTLTVSNANGCVSSANNFTVTVNPLPTIALGATTAVCPSSSAQSTTLPYTAVTNSPTNYSITWNASPTNSFAPVSNASLAASPINIPIPANTAAGTYTGTLTVSNANGCISSTNNFTVTVNPLPTITLGSTTAVCTSSGAQSTTLPYTAVTNSPTNYSITWNASPTNTFVAVSNASLPSSSINIPIPANTAAGTYTGTLTVSNANGCVSSTNNFTVTVNPLPTITLGTTTAVCTSSGAQSTTLPYTAVANSPTTYSITWNASPTNSFQPVTDSALTSSPISIAVPAGTAAGTYTGTLTVKNGNGCVSSANSFIVTVNPLPTITLGSAGAVCFSSAIQSTSLTYSAVANAPTTYSIAWNASPTNNFLPVIDSPLTPGSISIVVPAGTAAGTYTGTLIVKNANGCTSSGNSFTVTVNSQPTITTSGNLTPICQSTSAQMASLLYSATTGLPISYSIDWATLNDQGSTAFSFDSGGGTINNINVSANVAAGTYNGVMTIFTSNGCSITQAVSLTIYDAPTINTTGVFSPVCQSSSSQTTTLSYNSTTGSPTSYAIDWIALTDQGATPFPFSSGSGDIINVNVPANTVAGTYNGIMTITTSNGCPATQAVSLTVNSVSAAPTASVTQQPTCVNNTGIITVTSPASGTGYTYSIDGIDFSNTTGIFTGLSSGVYNVQVKNSTSNCESEATPVTINASITKVWTGNADANWGNPANWSPTGVPIVSDCVDIPNVGIDPVISGTNASFFASRLTVENSGSLIVEETNSITVTNEVSVLGNGILIFEDQSSLVQVADVTNVGVITYRRKTPVRRMDLTYWSSPVTRDPGITLNEFSPETLFDKYLYWTSDFKWGTNLYGTMVMNAGEGYSIRGPQSFSTETSSVFTGEFIGVPNNGTIPGPPARAEKYCFFGNPYPSAIYADQFIHDNAANFYGTLYFWTHNTSPRIAVPGGNTYTYSNDDYAIYNLSGDTTVGGLSGIGAPSPGNQEPLHGYIAAGQGFFAKAITGQRAVFTNSMRVPNSNSQFYRSAKTEDIEKHRVWLNFTNTEGAFKQLLVGYITGATNSFDFNYDATTLNANPYVDFYSINEGKKLVIQGRALPFVVTDTIPLGYKSTIEEGDFTIAIDHADGDLANQDIYLQDNVTDSIHNLRSSGYTFRSMPGTFLNRFVLRYTNPNAGKNLGNEDFENQDQRIFVSVKDKNIKLESFSEQENLQEAAIYDTGGTLLYRKKQIGNKEWVITNFQSGPQVLLVKITLDSGKIVTKKIVFK